MHQNFKNSFISNFHCLSQCLILREKLTREKKEVEKRSRNNVSIIKKVIIIKNKPSKNKIHISKIKSTTSTKITKN